jgi:hypothetical protein
VKEGRTERRKGGRKEEKRGEEWADTKGRPKDPLRK